MLVCTLRGEGGGGLRKCTVCNLMKMLTFLDGPLSACKMHIYGPIFKIKSSTESLQSTLQISIYRNIYLKIS